MEIESNFNMNLEFEVGVCKPAKMIKRVLHFSAARSVNITRRNYFFFLFSDFPRTFLLCSSTMNEQTKLIITVQLGRSMRYGSRASFFYYLFFFSPFVVPTELPAFFFQTILCNVKNSSYVQLNDNYLQTSHKVDSVSRLRNHPKPKQKRIQRERRNETKIKCLIKAFICKLATVFRFEGAFIANSWIKRFK